MSVCNFACSIGASATAVSGRVCAKSGARLDSRPSRDELREASLDFNFVVSVVIAQVPRWPLRGMMQILKEEPLLDVNILKEIGKKALVDALNSVNGGKTLVLDASLAGPEQHHGVDKMFWLEAGSLTSTTPNIVYLCRPMIKYVKIIADQIKRHAKESQKHTYTLLLVPRISTLEGVLGDVRISSYNLQFIPIADDVISLENDNASRRFGWCDGDETVIYDSAQALLTLEKMYGLFPRIVGKGDHAATLTSDSTTPDTLLTQSDKIDSLIVLDRRVDMITPLLTQLTYEGLIDELIGVKNSHVELPVSLLTPPAPGSCYLFSRTNIAGTTSLKKVEAKKKHHLTTSTDPLFAELRDLNFPRLARGSTKLPGAWNRIIRQGRHQATTVAQLRDFVGKLGGLQTDHQSLRLHTGLSELLVPLTRTDLFNKTLEIQQNLLASYEIPAQITAIEDLIAQGADMQTVLRLLCLTSITAGVREIPLRGLRKSCRLLIDDSPEALDEVENDISFVYSGYAPISIRLVQCVAQKGGVISNPAEKEKAGGGAGADDQGAGASIAGWRGFEDIVATIPGETVDIVQNGQSGSSVVNAPMASLLRPMQKPTTTVVFFLGGCTYTEIAALRWVGRQNRGIVNGNSLFESISGAPKAAATGPKDAAI
ncbi:Sec1-like protein [Mycena haematopus]|nr:Sec1-like protein [Mycena haematopus]